MVRLISRQRGGLAALNLTKLFGIDDFPAAKDSAKVLIIIIYCYLIIIIIIIITSETGITIYNYKSHRKLINVKRLKKKRLVCINLRPEYFSKNFCHEFHIGFITFMQ